MRTRLLSLALNKAWNMLSLSIWRGVNIFGRKMEVVRKWETLRYSLWDLWIRYMDEVIGHKCRVIVKAAVDDEIWDMMYGRRRKETQNAGGWSVDHNSGLAPTKWPGNTLRGTLNTRLTDTKAANCDIKPCGGDNKTEWTTWDDQNDQYKQDQGTLLSWLTSSLRSLDSPVCLWGLVIALSLSEVLL